MRYQKNTFLVIPNKQMLKGETPITQAVYIRLCDYINDDLTCYPSYETISISAGCSRRSAMRAITRLCEMGILKKEQRYNTSNMYYVNIAGDKESLVTESHPPVTESHPPVTESHPNSIHLTQQLNSTSKEVQQSGPPPVEGREEMEKEDTQIKPMNKKPEAPPPTSAPPPPQRKKTRSDIQELIYAIQKECEKIGCMYESSREREFAKHILDSKAFGEFAEKAGKTRHDTAISVLRASVQVNYRKGPTAGPRAIYKEYAEVYNQFLKEKTKKPLHSIGKLC